MQRIVALSVELIFRVYARMAGPGTYVDPATTSSSIDAPFTAGVPSAQWVAFLRPWVRRFPYWREGHDRLAVAALACGETRLAHGSAHAVLKLARNAAWRERGNFLLAASYVRGRDPDRAIPLLEEIASRRAATVLPAVREELAAAYVAKERIADALACLNAIPEAARTPAAKVLIEHLERKARDDFA